MKIQVIRELCRQTLRVYFIINRSDEGQNIGRVRRLAKSPD